MRLNGLHALYNQHRQIDMTMDLSKTTDDVALTVTAIWIITRQAPYRKYPARSAVLLSRFKLAASVFTSSTTPSPSLLLTAACIHQEDTSRSFTAMVFLFASDVPIPSYATLVTVEAGGRQGCGVGSVSLALKQKPPFSRSLDTRLHHHCSCLITECILHMCPLSSELVRPRLRSRD